MPQRKILRASVSVCFVATAVIFGFFSYFVLAAYEKQGVTSRYNNIAEYALTALVLDFNAKSNAVLTLAKTANYGSSNATAWPNVYLNGFFDITTSIRDSSGITEMYFAPMVLPHQLPSFRDFLSQYLISDPDVPDNVGVPGFVVYGINYFVEPMIYEETTCEARSYVSPNKIATPLVQFLYSEDFSPQYFGGNLHSLPEFGPTIDAVIACSQQHNYSEAIRACTNSSTITLVPLSAPLAEARSFHTSIIQPVYLNHNSSELVGFVGGTFEWLTLLSPMFTTNKGGIDVVLTNKDFVYTFSTSRHGLVQKSPGDVHERKYNNYGYKQTFFTSPDGSDNACTYTIRIYPTEEFFDMYTTTTPILAALCSALLVVLCATTFYFYDHYMRKATEANEAVLETKRRFVRFISHEIRTPLNAVHLGLEALTTEMQKFLEQGLIAELQGTGERFPDLANTLRGWLELSAEMMGNSVSAVDVLNDLLNYDKIEMGTLRLEFSAVPIVELVQTVTVAFLTSAKHKNIHVSLDNKMNLSDDLEQNRSTQCVVIGDKNRLAQVMRNLISNAIKFTPENGAVAVHVERITDTRLSPQLVLPVESVHLLEQPRAGSIRISVTDSGVGLTAEQLAQICSEGVQFNANELQAGKGSGLGLFITKGIVEQHGGKLTILSAGVGAGTTFTVELPLFLNLGTSISLRSISSKRQIYPDCTPPRTEVSATREAPSTPSAVAGAAGAGAAVDRPKRILVVDDATSNRKLLVRLLTNKGYVCEQAEDGQQAIDVYRASLASGLFLDAITMDFEMPVMNGPTATGHLRAMGCTVPIIGVTGNMLPDDIKCFKVQGATEVMGKPLNMALFDRILRRNG